VETVDVPTPMIEDQAPEEQVAQDPTDTEREIVPVSPSSSPVRTAVTVVVARQGSAKRTVREQANEIMMMLETAMERVCAWSQRVKAQSSVEATAHELRRVVETEERASVGSREGAGGAPKGAGG
jgi:hypothetical protein